MDKGILLVDYQPSPMEEKEILHYKVKVFPEITWKVICEAQRHNSLYWKELHERPGLLSKQWSQITMSLQERYNLGVEIVQTMEYIWIKAADWGHSPPSGDYEEYKRIKKKMLNRLWDLNNEYLQNMNEETVRAGKAQHGFELIAELIGRFKSLG